MNFTKLYLELIILIVPKESEKQYIVFFVQIHFLSYALQLPFLIFNWFFVTPGSMHSTDLRQWILLEPFDFFPGLPVTDWQPVKQTSGVNFRPTVSGVTWALGEWVEQNDHAIDINSHIEADIGEASRMLGKPSVYRMGCYIKEAKTRERRGVGPGVKDNIGQENYFDAFGWGLIRVVTNKKDCQMRENKR